MANLRKVIHEIRLPMGLRQAVSVCACMCIYGCICIRTDECGYIHLYATTVSAVADPPRACMFVYVYHLT